MVLIKSISGIRGTIGGRAGDNLTPLDIVKFTAAFGTFVKKKHTGRKLQFVVGRDARISGEMVEQLVVATLTALGIDVINTGLSTTPTVEMAVIEYKALGGIIITASHNPAAWNALKLLNEKGEFISAEEGHQMLEMAEKEAFDFVAVDELGKLTTDSSTIDKHIERIIDLKLVNRDAIAKADFKVVVDGVHSTGGIAIPQLLKALGVKQVTELYCQPTGHFPHNPEPLPENLGAISTRVIETGADLGIVVDPDVDRLALVTENGDMFGEEYTLVAVADYVLQQQKGNTVSNLSSSRALQDITEKHGGSYYASAVGEVNVVEKMKEVDAVIGGEGNGGVIYPGLHYGRDALVGIALLLSYLAQKQVSLSELKLSYPAYAISKNKIELGKDDQLEPLFDHLKKQYSSYPVSTIDGVKIDFEDGWVHLRPSNTEPIIRVYAESSSEEKANTFAERIIQMAGDFMGRS
jgi:phosphomannomutase